MDDELAPIGDEVQRQLEQVGEAQSTSVDWTEQDEAQLQEELARVKFNPAHANPDIPDTYVVVDGIQRPVHGYNNFLVILETLDDVFAEREFAHLSFQAAYASVRYERNYDGVFGIMRRQFPALYKRALILQEERDVRVRHVKRLEQVPANLMSDEERYIASQAYSVAAKIAKEIDPQYDLGYLHR